jgi:hypothetical protein
VIRVVRSVVLALGSAAAWCAAEPLHAQCSSAQHHQFDFVVGNWLVRDSSGQAIGTVTVSHQYGDCVLIERWRGAANSGEGLGVIGYQPGSSTWHRDYIDPGGFLLESDGRLEGSAMVMTGKDYQPDGVRMHRVTWTPRRDGSVEERWQTSTDAGRSWRVRFYGVLSRIAE